MAPDTSYFEASSSSPRSSLPASPTAGESSQANSRRSSADDAERTNTLIITQLPREFFEPSILQALRHHFESYGDIHAWAPLKSFARIILVYYDVDDAEHAKQTCDRLVVGATEYSPGLMLRVYRADPTPIRTGSHIGKNGMDEHYLCPPVQERNFLISPPGSPPVGWEQIQEDPPNATPLADDLIAALRKLELQRNRGSGPEVLLEPQEGVGIGVYVEDCADDMEVEQKEIVTEEGWAYGEMSPGRQQWRPVPTALPPMRVGG